MKVIYDFPDTMTIDELVNLIREIESEIGITPIAVEVNDKLIKFEELTKSPE